MKRFALVVGASGGIGQEIAKKLALDGWNLYLQYTNGEDKIRALQKQLEEIGVESFSIQADLSSSSGVETLLQQLFSVEAVIFAHGTSHYGLFQDVKEEEMDLLWTLHVKSPMMISQKLISKLQKGETPSIVFISSIWGQTGAACEVVYSTVKGAQIAFVKSLAKELAPARIKVNAVAPGAVNTRMMAQFSSEELDEIAEEIPMGRLAEPTEIAAVVSFLCSSASSYLTGQVVSVNGGWYT
ncbi:elongation factor P 5-aminopentanone reductase [Bacillus sp. FJAT-42315]|uniref:elongation factor P 5-aminopentanone reductase n=1 Tax=Bacillus sp. FJAT-42315 TaxID=2014077 RepID=UPI000C24DBAA|nr:SDR family oxidoreductase [Bacillus sp. FJAT-42315]